MYTARFPSSCSRPPLLPTSLLSRSSLLPVPPAAELPSVAPESHGALRSVEQRQSMWRQSVHTREVGGVGGVGRRLCLLCLLRLGRLCLGLSDACKEPSWLQCQPD